MRAKVTFRAVLSLPEVYRSTRDCVTVVWSLLLLRPFRITPRYTNVQQTSLSAQGDLSLSRGQGPRNTCLYLPKDNKVLHVISRATSVDLTKSRQKIYAKPALWNFCYAIHCRLQSSSCWSVAELCGQWDCQWEPGMYTCRADLQYIE